MRHVLRICRTITPIKSNKSLHNIYRPVWASLPYFIRLSPNLCSYNYHVKREITKINIVFNIPSKRRLLSQVAGVQ